MNNDKLQWQILDRLSNRKNPCCVDKPINAYWTWTIQGASFKGRPCQQHDDVMQSLLTGKAKTAASIDLTRHED